MFNFDEEYTFCKDEENKSQHTNRNISVKIEFFPKISLLETERDQAF